MSPEEIKFVVGTTPHTHPDRGRNLYDFIRKYRLTRCLELGFAHGVGTVWIAGAVQTLGRGKVVAVDNHSAFERTPSAQDLIIHAGLESLVDLHYDPISYTWHLMRNLEAYVLEPFEFVFIDGAHTWDTDGFAFFLVEKVLRPGGWILFDDLDWSYSKSPAALQKEFVRSMTDEQKNTAQIRQVWEKLVLQHSGFGNFIEDNGWGWAQKLANSSDPRLLEIKTTSPSLPERLIHKLLSR
ncbi:class I SAM-dependent methyltransferase [Microvirga sp. P5_D2]